MTSLHPPITIIYIRYIFLKSVKLPLSTDSIEEEKVKQPEIFKAFTKPERLTEEEASISKEKKICLVCKGKVRKFDVFICDCGAFYCDKCVKALIELENQCWACGAALDESKRGRVPEKEEEIVLEKGAGKKNRGDVK